MKLSKPLREMQPSKDNRAGQEHVAAAPARDSAKQKLQKDQWMNALATTELPVASKPFANRRLAREWKTVSAMIRIYCRDKHDGAEQLCPECQDLSRYVSLRLDRCRFGEEKPTCARCPVHCYQRDRREQIKVVMRYAGPRMTWEHPWLSLWHLLDGWFRKAHIHAA